MAGLWGSIRAQSLRVVEPVSSPLSLEVLPVSGSELPEQRSVCVQGLWRGRRLGKPRRPAPCAVVRVPFTIDLPVPHHPKEISREATVAAIYGHL